MQNTKELLKELTQTVGVAGEETCISELLKKKLSDFGEVTIDQMNNVSCTFGSGYHIQLEAHLDEIGLIVTEITEDGFLKFEKCGGVDSRMLLGYEVTVHGRKDCFGVISTLPPHLQKKDDSRHVPDPEELSIDVGMNFDTASKLISPGDKVTFARNFTCLSDDAISASCLDDRSGVAAVLLAAEQLRDVPCQVTLLFTSQEELGTRGAKTAPFGKKVDESISVDVSFAYSPGCKKEECGEMGKGPMIGISPILNREISDKLIKTAEKFDTPYQLEVMNGRTGTNADVITLCETGIPCGLISIPEKYMHTPIETVSVKDVENVAKLIADYVKERAGEMNA